MGLEIQENELHDTISHRMTCPVETVEVGSEQAPVKEVVLTGDEWTSTTFPP